MTAPDVSGYDGPEPGTVDVWWAALTQLRPTHDLLLSTVERARADAYVHRDDRRRFVLAAAMLRLVAGAALDRAPEDVEVDRRCHECGRHHARPRVEGAAWDVSVSHSGHLAVLAVSDAAVGIDVECIDTSHPDLDAVRGLVLSPQERARRSPLVPMSGTELLAVWTAKESALKATGEGLRTAMTDVVVPDALARSGPVTFRRAPTRQAWMSRLHGPEGSVAALTTLGAGPRPVRVRSRVAAPVETSVRSDLR